MAKEQFDIFISGAGPAGLIAAAAFAHDGYSVCLADPMPPVTDGTSQSADQRSTAFLQPAKALFQQTGLWDQLQPHGVPLNALRIVDTTGTPPEVRDERVFQSSDVGDQPFGWNFMNWRIRGVLLDHLNKQPNISLRFGTGFQALLSRTSGAIVTLGDGTRVEAKLVIAADGRTSPLRDAVGIPVQTTRYGQKSLAFVATHTEPHHNISTEIYHEGGPFTMVPLADINGVPASAIVWMNKGRKTIDIAALPRDGLNREMTLRSASLFGPMEVAGPIAVWPIISQRATQLTAERTALIAETAHVLPPIGAQGLNTSLNDIAALLEAARTHPLGEPAMLKSYAKARQRDIANRARVIDLFNRVTRSGDIGLQSLRLAGLKVVHDFQPLRQSLMRAGLGPSKNFS
ncbi:MAG: FAD-dependent monooxygenase [Paracoccaceae bacterium]